MDRTALTFSVSMGLEQFGEKLVEAGCLPILVVGTDCKGFCVVAPSYDDMQTDLVKLLRMLADRVEAGAMKHGKEGRAMEGSKIQWTHHTFNPWRGCTKVSPGCANCYAEAMSARDHAVLGTWGKEGTRAIAAEAYWREPVRWNAGARQQPERRLVFCASLADVFEGRDTVPADAWAQVERARQRLWTLIAQTPALDWLLLTKRPEEVERTLVRLARANVPNMERWPWANVWLGTSVEDQQRADERIPHLLAAPARLRFLSIEPMLGPIDLSAWLARPRGPMSIGEARQEGSIVYENLGIDWVIIGGESGTGARSFDVDACEQLVGQCRSAGVPVFVKQFGTRPDGLGYRLAHKKGGDLDEWPAPFQVREFPKAPAGAR